MNRKKTTDVQQRFIELFTEAQQDHQKIALAVSGGSDSMFMLSLCLTLPYPFIVFHIHHGTRAQCDEEAEFLKKYCSQKGVECVVLYAKGLSLNMANFEDKAREERYRLFKEGAEAYGVNTILTAHHREDVVETVFLKMLRGSSHLYIPEYRFLDSAQKIKVYRPMLDISKEVIESFLKEKNIIYYEDHSNDDPHYLRNFLRKEIFPLLKNKISHLTEKVLNLSHQRSKEENFLNEYTDSRKEHVFPYDHCELGAFHQEHPLIQQKILQKVARNLLDIILSYRHLEELCSLIKQEHHHSIVLLQNSHGVLRKEAKKIVFSPKNEQKALEKNSFIIHNKQIKYFFEDWKISIVVGQGFRYSLDDEICTRTWQQGEKIPWQQGHKKISKILKDRKVPLSSRTQVLVLVKNEQRVGLLGTGLCYIIPQERAKDQQQGLYFSKNAN